MKVKELIKQLQMVDENTDIDELKCSGNKVELTMVDGLSKRFRKLVDDVIDNIDFKKIHKAMQIFEWDIYFNETKECRLATEKELEQIGRRLLTEVARRLQDDENYEANSPVHITTAGFRAWGERHSNFDDPEIILHLEWILEDASCYE